jgi:hypothetical protein
MERVHSNLMDIYKMYMRMRINEQQLEVLMKEHEHSLVLLNSEGVRYLWQTKLLLASLPVEPHASRSLLLTILICSCVCTLIALTITVVWDKFDCSTEDIFLQIFSLVFHIKCLIPPLNFSCHILSLFQPLCA